MTNTQINTGPKSQLQVEPKDLERGALVINSCRTKLQVKILYKCILPSSLHWSRLTTDLVIGHDRTGESCMVETLDPKRVSEYFSERKKEGLISIRIWIWPFEQRRASSTLWKTSPANQQVDLRTAAACIVGSEMTILEFFKGMYCTTNAVLPSKTMKGFYNACPVK